MRQVQGRFNVALTFHVFRHTSEATPPGPPGPFRSSTTPPDASP